MRTAVHNTRLLLDLGEQLIKGGKQFQFRVEGLSMHPAIQNGDLVRVAGVHPDRIRVGNIVLCRADRKPVIHRVVSIQKVAGRTLLTLRGDACASPDAPVEACQVIGKVLAIQRGNRFIKVGARHAHLAHSMRAIARQLKRRILLVSSICRAIFCAGF